MTTQASSSSQAAQTSASRASASQTSDERVVHVLEFPGGYTRSTGPVIGRFLTGLRSGRLFGVRMPDGRVLVPPTEYDPQTAAALGTADEDWVEVGPAGTVTTWTWVDDPRPDHPLDRPFAWALIRPDGADTALLHAVDSGSKAAMATGMRVHPTWRAERTGAVKDIACFAPGEGPAEVPALVPAPDGEAELEPVSMVTLPHRLEYRLRGGTVWNHFIDGMAVGQIRGTRCAKCGKVFVPPRGACPGDGVPATEWVDLPDTGVLTTFAVNNVPAAGAPEVPFISGYVLLDGADIAMLALVSDVPWQEVRIGMRVRGVWVPDAERTRSVKNLKWFAPTGEPDVPFEQFEEYV
ncbi:Zn-ribbon domain-containing OB-fold protein [Catenulispora pinisilvae]|uniref:Zn-ribbon domain-containing OB-fold protein n=1 Tax=Catenulispora pinisilvae TaxID=2705253 RepID=UPI0018921911|nr:OB-fold nucleic acid binding domain-containing protein [Catenulispora pinisilvae]